jgi:hypothetical protein
MLYQFSLRGTMRRRTFFTAVIGCLALVLFLFTGSTKADTITGGDTSVALNSGTVTALTGLGLTLAPLGSASFDASTLTITFPITGGTIGSSGDIFNHNGSGLSISNGTTTVDLENFVVNTSTLLLSGKVVIGSTTIPSVNLFDIGAGDVLTLDPTAGAALASALNIPNLSGATIGVATVSPQVATPEPSTVGLLAVGLLGLCAAGLFGSRRHNQLQTA